MRKRPSAKRFDRAPQVGINRSTFDLSFPYKTTFDSGLLIPLPPIEIYPGDSFRLRMFSLCRQATPLHPTMGNLKLSSFFFFVPNRLVWDNWQKFMGEQENPGDSTDYLVPVIADNAAAFADLDPADYVGLPTNVANVRTNLDISALPFRGINLCINEWFRDENLQNSLPVPTGDGPDTYGGNYNTLFRRGKRKDYLSSALPWPQKGPAINLPLGESAPIYFEGQANGIDIATIKAPGSTGLDIQLDSSGSKLTALGSGASDFPLLADLTNATAATINELRQAFQLQKLAERDARGGTRYREILKSHFQVDSPDARLQRPEYLGGGVTPIQMRTVPQTSSTDATTPQANLAAYAEGHIAGHGFTKSFVEHGYIISFISVQADLVYQNRMDRHWGRQTKYDYYWPALQSLGEQPVYNYEAWVGDDGTANKAVWGYQERWAELRTQLGFVTGLFRSNASGTLDPWHYALDFQTRPALDAVFVEDTPPVKRTVAVKTEPEFLFDAWFDVRAARPLPVYSVPGYIDHF